MLHEHSQQMLQKLANSSSATKILQCWNSRRWRKGGEKNNDDEDDDGSEEEEKEEIGKRKKGWDKKIKR